MPKGHKIRIDPYSFNDEETRLDKDTGEVTTTPRERTIVVQEVLPLQICNPQIGGKLGEPAPDFDLTELGPVADKIRGSKDKQHVILDAADYKLVEKRVRLMAKQVGLLWWEMIRRVLEAKEVELKEG